MKLSRNTSFSFGSAVGNGLGDGIGVGVGVGVGAAVGAGVELDDEVEEDELEEALDDLEGLLVASGVGVGSSEGGVAAASGCGVGVGEGSTFWYVDKKPEFKAITITAAATNRIMTPVSAKSLFRCIIILPKSRLEV